MSAARNANASATKPTRPNGWTAKHDAFIRGCASNHEDVNSTKILFETEFPNIPVSKAWIQSRMNA
ncbi:hypothetical protein PV10_01298 [Exophiala mesophila]|uniref:Uncharacterized protein n=1 Tax=Exophiala mesophila TaxID=212818 RepID=A0A0D1ZUG7_EXOME|nr:uncharacterized protein PV10_01298 [Exophiala mesophila]KIV97564.1 hypothetical protein PV10_01298 [Exophiala mesophila]